MASYSPPTESLPIFDNAVFPTANTNTILTVGQANLLYLRKTYADTATALETFSAGINTNTINGTTTSSTINIGSNLNLGTLNLGQAGLATQNMSVGIMTGANTAGSINIGSASNSVIFYSASSKFNNGIQANSFDPPISGGTFNIATTSPPVTINIGTASGTTALNLGVAGTSTTTNNGALTSTGLITANGGLTMGTGKNITLSGTVTPTAGQLGYTDTTLLATGFTISNTGGTATLLTTAVYPVGVWLITYQATFYFASTVTISNINTYLFGPTFFNTIAYAARNTTGTQTLTGTNVIALQTGSVCFNLTTAASISLMANVTANLACKASGADTSYSQQCYITATRIA